MYELRSRGDSIHKNREGIDNLYSTFGMNMIA